jgi:hypothetical protein
MLSSNHIGEIAAAGSKAAALVRAHGLTWSEIISPPPTAGSTVEDLIEEALGAGVLNAWEEGFLLGIHGRPISHLQATQQARAHRP